MQGQPVQHHSIPSHLMARMSPVLTSSSRHPRRRPSAWTPDWSTPRPSPRRWSGRSPPETGSCGSPRRSACCRTACNRNGSTNEEQRQQQRDKARASEALRHPRPAPLSRAQRPQFASRDKLLPTMMRRWETANELKTAHVSRTTATKPTKTETLNSRQASSRSTISRGRPPGLTRTEALSGCSPCTTTAHPADLPSPLARDSVKNLSSALTSYSPTFKFQVPKTVIPFYFESIFRMHSGVHTVATTPN